MKACRATVLSVRYGTESVEPVVYLSSCSQVFNHHMLILQALLASTAPGPCTSLCAFILVDRQSHPSSAPANERLLASSQLQKFFVVLQSPPLSVPAGLLTYLLVKFWSVIARKLRIREAPFTAQENAVVQTCVVAGSALAWGAGFPSALLGEAACGLLSFVCVCCPMKLVLLP